jgi:cytochrome c peroxidase
MRSLVFICMLTACGEDPAPRAPAPPQEPPPPPPRPLREVVGDTFEALPETVELNREKVLLGRRLYHERMLSGDGQVSCATCHSLSHGGAEPRRTSVGVRGWVGPLNAPSTLNASLSFRQYWDGRAEDLEAHAESAIENPLELRADWRAIEERLEDDESWVEAFGAIYQRGISRPNTIDALVEYQRSLITPSPFDRWLRGDDGALTEEQQAGLRLFVEIGCARCHRGVNIGGASFEKLGVEHDYFERRGGHVTEFDRGRFRTSAREDERYSFRVAPLRNVALTAPYFHDGSEPELAAAVRTMAYVQLDRELSQEDSAAIVAFLGSLTGELPAEARP